MKNGRDEMQNGESNGNGLASAKRANGVPTLRYATSKGVFFHADCLKLLAVLESSSIDMVFVDPPFNLGKQYEGDLYNDSLATEVYRNWCRDWLLELVRVLRPGGALFLYHWPFWLMQLGAWLQTVPTVQYKSWIAMKMKSGFPIKGRLHPAHYGLLYFVKRGLKPTFNVVRHRTPTCRHCGKMTRDYGGYRHKFDKFEDKEGIPWIQISDFWEDTRPARQDKSRKNKINELPLHIPERAILMASKRGDVILDVFGGGTFHAAQLHDRLWIGCELGDTDPVIRRVRTFFDLPVELPTGKLKNCFTDAFWDARVAALDVKGLDATVAKVAPLDTVVKSMEEYGSKSRILGF